MHPDTDPAQVCERHGDANRTVATHTEVTGIVEVDDARRTSCVRWFA
jgi:hypothetical protein